MTLVSILDIFYFHRLYCHRSHICVLSFANLFFLFCYDLRLGSGCNSGKDLSRVVGMSQLVKHKDTGLYLQLYIPTDNELNILLTYVEWVIKQWGRWKETTPTTWGTDWDYFSTADHWIIKKLLQYLQSMK